jgi:hypothetical protein
MKNIKMRYSSIILLVFSAFIALYAPRIATSQQAAVSDPFEVAPQKNVPNCDREYRFKYDIEIKSADDFISFLQKHQDGDLDSYKPERDKVIPLRAYDSMGKKMVIDLEKVKDYVKVLEVERSMLSNTKIYKLDITHKDYDKDMWPWLITVQMSDKGCFSVIYCAGI